MCAINGCTGKDEALVERMDAVTKHRGPDATKLYSDNGVTLGFNRLAIIDLSPGGMQPMWSADNRYVIVYNGEIYNYRELKKELSSYEFKNQSDTEVILAAYLKWGDEAFAKLNGMFAIALWDTKEQKLTLVRDPVGIKPLYYHRDESRLVFSSELKSLLEAGIPRVLNQEALGHYLRLMYVPSDMTMIKDVRKLLPGHLLTYQNNVLTNTSFVKPPDAAQKIGYTDAVTAVKKVVTDAVERQLVSDRPVGIYLSGGVDSTCILAAASAVHPAINTFSVGYDLNEGEEREKFNADVELAKRTAVHFGATHHEYQLTSEKVRGLFDEMIDHLHQPVGNATALAQLFLAHETKPTATVVLSGEGGDELFGGYERYRLALLAERYTKYVPKAFGAVLPERLRKGFLRGTARYAQLMYQKDSEIGPLLKTSTLPNTNTLFEQYFAHDTDVAALMYTDLANWLVDEALLRGDAMSMAASVEVRVPLLDDAVRALAYSLPVEYKVTGSTTKKVFKDAFRDVMPAYIVTQPKRGWFSPGAKWLRRPEFVELVNVVFADNYTEASALFNLDAVRAMWENHRTKRSYHFTELWAILVFLSWAKAYKISI